MFSIYRNLVGLFINARTVLRLLLRRDFLLLFSSQFFGRDAIAFRGCTFGAYRCHEGHFRSNGRRNRDTGGNSRYVWVWTAL